MAKMHFSGEKSLMLKVSGVTTLLGGEIIVYDALVMRRAFYKTLDILNINLIYSADVPIYTVNISDFKFNYFLCKLIQKLDP